MVAKRLRYGMLGISWSLFFQPIENFPASDTLGLPMKPQFFILRAELNPFGIASVDCKSKINIKLNV